MMKRFSFVLMVIAVLFATTFANAAVTPPIPAESVGWKRSIHIEWGYIPPLDMVVSEFVLYQDDAKVCTFPGKDITTGDCEVTLKKVGTSFTLAAKFGDGKESPKSPAFVFADFGPGPKIIILIGK